MNIATSCWLLLNINVWLLHAIRPGRLRVEYEENPIGIDVVNPRFFWSIDGESVRGAKQTAYQIIVYNEDIGNKVADTGKVSSAKQGHITVSGLKLQSHVDYKWTVQIYDAKDTASNIETGYFSSGLLDSTQWDQIDWIGIDPSKDTPTMNEFRTQFVLNQHKTIKKAIAYIACPGYYKLWLNEDPIDDHELGYFTTFEARTYYDIIPISKQLNNEGTNVIGFMLGNGWYSQPTIAIGPNMIKFFIFIQYTDGTLDVFSTSSMDIYQSEGPIRINDIYLGEYYDATKETHGWLTPSYNYSNWKTASIISKPTIGVLKSSAIMPKAKKIESYTAKSISEPQAGIYVIDFGQNVAGFCRVAIPGNNKRGKNVTIIHSEELQRNGLINQMWPEKSPMMFNITLRGDGNEEIYEAFFTFFGYQYIQIIGYPGVPTQNSITSYFIHTNMDTSTGSIVFGPSNINHPESNAYLMNGVQHMTRYSALGNYINIPSDCPQRERRGWLGDAQLAAETLLHNFDMASSYTKFLLDIHDTQIQVNASGALPEIAPWYQNAPGHIPGDPAWTTAYVNLVYWMYRYYGDKHVINFHYKGLKAYMNNMESQLNKTLGILPLKYSIHGDWDGYYDFGHCKNSASLINTFDWAQQCRFMSVLANVIGESNDSKAYLNKYNAARKAIYNYYWDKSTMNFIDPNGQLCLQTTNSIGLYLDILNDTNELETCVTNLVKDITVTHNHHIGPGIVGTKLIWPQLCRFGHCDVALNASMQRTVPGYGWWYLQGATTLWEHWEASKYNSSKCGNVGSKNHIMFGGQGGWYYSDLGGIKQPYDNSSNWKYIVIDPYTNSTIFGIDFIETQLDTLNGKIIVDYEIYRNNTDNIWEILNVEIPTGSVATIYIRRLDVFQSYIPISKWIIKEGKTVVYQNMKFINGVDGVKSGTNEGDDAVTFEIQSGSYSFSLET
eukprot:156595_1